MDQGHDLLQIKKELVIYLDKTSDLCMIEEMANSYKDIFNQISHLHFAPPLNISLALNYIMLAEISGEYASLLLSEPYVAKEILSSLVKTCCIVLADLSDVRVYLQLRLLSFPDLPDFSSDKDCFKHSGLCLIYGILYELQPTQKYTQKVLYQCENQNCYAPDSVTEKPGICPACGRKVSEVPQSRITGEKVCCLILHPKFLEPSTDNRRTQSILVEFRDDLIIGLEIGMRYKIAVTHEKSKYLAWGVVPVLPEPMIRSLSNACLPAFPESIVQILISLREETHGSPWALVTGLAAHLTSDLFPLASFLHLKTALLLSLASICSRCPVPILALGDCSILLTEAWKCSPRAISAPNGPLSLLLATHGVCFIQENINLSYVKTAVESELVTLKMDNLSKENKFCTYPLRTAVWLSWQCNKHSNQDVHRLKTLIEIFGIPFLEDVDVKDEDISLHLLSNSINSKGTNQSNICKEDFRKFIDIISCQHVQMSPMASALIRNYFVASRRERPECLPLKSIKVLTGLSESHARLSMRDTVTFEDAVAAIFLYEESIGIIFGPSMYSKQPKRVIDSGDAVSIARQMDNVYGRFSLWLSSYTKSHNSTDNNSEP